MASTDDPAERLRALGPALDAIIDICLKLGITAPALESFLRVRTIQRAAETLPRDPRTGREPTHEAIALATGLYRREVQNVLAQGAKNAQTRVLHSQRTSKTDRILTLWSTKPRYRSNAGTPLDLPFELYGNVPTFSELSRLALPGRKPKNVLRELQRRRLVQCLPDDLVHLLPRAGRPIGSDMTAKTLSYTAEQLRLLGSTLIHLMAAQENAPPSHFAAYISSKPVQIETTQVASIHSELVEEISSNVQAFEQEFHGPKGGKKTKGGTLKKGQREPTKTVGVSYFLWEE